MSGHNGTAGLFFLATSTLALLAAPAFAHIDLLEPEARAHGTGIDGERDVNSDQKRGPCGQITNGPTTRIATYAPGDTVRVRVREEINHSSYIRVAFDPEGDDFPQRPEARLAPEEDNPEEAEAALFVDSDSLLLGVLVDDNSVFGGMLEYEIELPNVECDACTLQVIQYMYNRSDPYYYQCADLTLTSKMAGAGADAGMPEVVPAPVDAGTPEAVPAPVDEGIPEVVPAPVEEGIPEVVPAPVDEGMPEVAPAPVDDGVVTTVEQEDDGGGCSLGRVAGGYTGWLGLAGLALAGMLRRRVWLR